MIGWLSEGWSDHALGHDARRAFQPRGRIRQVFLAINAVKFLHVFWVRIHYQQMSGHGTFLSDWMLSDGSHIGSASALMGVRNPDRPPSQPHPLRLRLPEIRAALL